MSSSPSGFATRISSPAFSPSIRLRVPLSSPRVVLALVALDGAVSLLSPPFCRYLLPAAAYSSRVFPVSPVVPPELPSLSSTRLHFASLSCKVQPPRSFFSSSLFHVLWIFVSLSIYHPSLSVSSSGSTRWRNNKHKVQREERNNGRA